MNAWRAGGGQGPGLPGGSVPGDGEQGRGSAGEPGNEPAEVVCQPQEGADKFDGVGRAGRAEGSGFVRTREDASGREEVTEVDHPVGGEGALVYVQLQVVLPEAE
jgi:hypothetical protein